MKSKLLLVFALLCNCVFAQPNISLVSYVTGFSSPVDIANCGDDRLFVVERSGFIRVIENGTRLTTAFLNIDSKVNSGNYNEQGLLGLAFHPDYKNNGYFFVYYVNNNSDLSISRFSVTSNPNIADANSEVVVLTIPHPNYPNHNGGNLEFGKDGYLYIAVGDGGGAGDTDNSSQDPLSFTGKMLRLDVDSLPYTFPPDNPYIHFASVRNEIWARGLRNPWRFSFDRLTGDLWIGDVGQDAREEVDFQPASSTGGENYGWRCYEGNLSYNSSGCQAMSNYTFPVFDYANPTLGCSVIGGYVYRGCQYPGMFGYYVFADYCSGKFWTIHDSSSTWVTHLLFDDANSRYSSFGEDRNGEIYVAGLSNGIIYKVTEANPTTLPAITAANGVAFCPGDSVTLSTTSQVGIAAYNWLKNDTPVASGLQVNAKETAAYSLQTTGTNGCVYTTPALAVTQRTPPASPVITSATNSYCAGDSLLLSTAQASTYRWSDGALTQTNYVQQGNYSLTITDVNGCSAASSSGVTITENPLPQPVIQQAGTLCGISSVILSTTVGYSGYSWSNFTSGTTTTVSQPGNYSVIVTDANGCNGTSAQYSVVAQSFLTPALTAQNGNTLCPGAATTLSASGIYDTYLWSTGETTAQVNVQNAGFYWVSVSDSSGCAGNSDTLEIIGLIAPAPTVTAQNGVAFCAGDSTRLSLSGSYTSYSWSTGDTTATISVKNADAYTATVTNNAGCVGNSNTVTVTTYPLPTPVIVPGHDIVSCGDGVVEVLPYLGYPHYLWSRGDTGEILFVMSTGTFNVTVQDQNGCFGVSDSIKIEFVHLDSFAIYGDWPACVDSIYMDTSTYSYQWYSLETIDEDPFNFYNYTPIENSNTPCISKSQTYLYVQVFDTNGCSVLSDNYASIWEGIEETWLGHTSLQPNPFTNEITLDYVLKDLADIRVSLKDLAGKEIALLRNEKEGAGSHKLLINTAQYKLSRGIYFLEIANGTSRKVLKLEKM